MKIKGKTKHLFLIWKAVPHFDENSNMLEIEHLWPKRRICYWGLWRRAYYWGLKDNPISEHPYEDPITEKPKEDPITVKPKGHINEDPQELQDPQ